MVVWALDRRLGMEEGYVEAIKGAGARVWGALAWSGGARAGAVKRAPMASRWQSLPVTSSP
jgi:hypothetical protein